MFTNMNFALGMLLAKDLDQRDQITAGVLAAQFPGNSLLGPVLLKPTVVDRAQALKASEATVEQQKVAIADVEAKLQAEIVELKAQRAFVADIHAKVKTLLDPNLPVDQLKAGLTKVSDDLAGEVGALQGGAAASKGSPAVLEILKRFGVNTSDAAQTQQWMTDHPQVAAVLRDGAQPAQ